MPWTVEFHDDFEPEFLALELAVQDALLAVAKLLADYGPQLGRPYADTLKGSKHANMKELRFEASDGEWRVAFAFDPAAAGHPAGRRGQVGWQSEALLPAVDRKGGQAVFSASGSPESRKEGEVRWAGTLDQVIAELPPERRERVDARYRELSRRSRVCANSGRSLAKRS